MSPFPYCVFATAVRGVLQLAAGALGETFLVLSAA